MFKFNINSSNFKKYNKFILFGVDICFIYVSIFLSFWLSNNNFTKVDESHFYSFFINSAWIIVFIFYFSGHYKSLTRYVGSPDLYKISVRSLISISILSLLTLIFRFQVPPLKVLFLMWLLLVTSTSVLRFTLRDVLFKFLSIKNKNKPKVAIYGAGKAGAQLLRALRFSGKSEPVFFIDDDPNMSFRELNGLNIYNPNKLHELSSKIDQILFAIPSLSSKQKSKKLEKLQKYGIPTFLIPSIEELISGNSRIDYLKPVKIEDLLGRDIVPPDKSLLREGIKNKVVFISGAGGSIGSELCKQIIKFRPSKLILFDQSELNLYRLSRDLERFKNNNIDIVYLLGSTTDLNLINNIFKSNKIDIIFHAAAYKHVPLVEINPIEGIKNNVISIKNICENAKKFRIKKIILISTDKAVRPSNIMGASKRLSELIVQAYAQEELQENSKSFSCFSMVRFGNVLGSSGSVVPLFQEQISCGGPITITHESVVRYFMTITEAAQLVLQAAFLAKGGDLFLLDMGKPEKILNLAKKMISLSSLTVKDKDNPDGDIEIKTTGLRPGEKLYEELLIDGNAKKTSHKLIFQANEKFLSPDLLWPILEQLLQSLKNNDLEKSLNLLSELVPEWERSDINSK